MYLLSIDIDGEEYITVKYVQKSEHEGYIKLVSQNQHHADKEVEISRIRAIALINILRPFLQKTYFSLKVIGQEPPSKSIR